MYINMIDEINLIIVIIYFTLLFLLQTALSQLSQTALPPTPDYCFPTFHLPLEAEQF